MDLTDLRAAVRAETGNDDDDQVTDDQLNVWFWLAYKQLRRRLSRRLPELFTRVTSNVTLSGSLTTLDKPSDFEALAEGGIERYDETTWVSVPQASKVNPEVDSYLGFRERGAKFLLSPAAAVPGVYRIVYRSAPANCFPAEDIPTGFEDVLIQMVTAKAQIRFGGDPDPHRDEAERIYKEVSRTLAYREGNAPEPGFVPGYGESE